MDRKQTQAEQCQKENKALQNIEDSLHDNHTKLFIDLKIQTVDSGGTKGTGEVSYDEQEGFKK